MQLKFTLLFSSILLVASQSSVSATHTAMDDILEQQDIGCSIQLRHIAIDTLKNNPHRMLAANEQVNDIHLFNALAVSSFRDRDSHVTFHGVKNSDGSCDTSVTESYVLKTTCNDARNEAFSKWEVAGKLNARTTVLSSKRIKGKQAFLTSQFSSLCLITLRQVIPNQID